MQSATDEVEDLATLEALDEVKKNFWETFCVSLKRRCIFMELLLRRSFFFLLVCEGKKTNHRRSKIFEAVDQTAAQL